MPSACLSTRQGLLCTSVIGIQNKSISGYDIHPSGLTVHLICIEHAVWLNLHDKFKTCDATTKQHQLLVSTWAFYLPSTNLNLQFHYS